MDKLEARIPNKNSREEIRKRFYERQKNLKPCERCPFGKSPKCKRKVLVAAGKVKISSFYNCREFVQLDFDMSCENDDYFAHSSGCANPLEPEPRCEYCTEYDGNRCMKEWNNADDCYYVPERDDKEPDDCCDDYEWNGEDEYE